MKPTTPLVRCVGCRRWFATDGEPACPPCVERSRALATFRAVIALVVVLVAGCDVEERRRAAAEAYMGHGTVCSKSLARYGGGPIECIRDGRRWACAVSGAGPMDDHTTVACAPVDPAVPLPAEMPQ